MDMRLRKTIVYLLVALAIAVIALILATPWLVSTDLVRSAIEREMNTFTGRPVTIGGDVTVRLFPGPTAVFDDVSLDVRGNEQQSILTVENVEADIAPWTLLSTNPSFTAIRLTRPHLRLTRNIDGTVNWRDSMGRIGSAIDMAHQKLEEDSEAEKLLDDGFPTAMAAIGITDGSILIDDLASQTMREISTINGTVNWLQLEGALDIDTTATWQENSISLDFNADKPLAFFAGKPTQLELVLENELGSIGFSGNLDFYETLFAEGQLEFSTPSTSALLEILGAKIDPGRAIGSLALSGAASLSNQRLRFDQATLSIDDNTGSGALEITGSEEGPNIVVGTLEFDSLDLSSFLGAFITLPSNRPPFEPPLNLDFMSQIQTDLRLSAQTAQFGDFEMSELAATAQINQTSAIFDIGDALAYSGNIQARLQFARDQVEGDTALMSLSGQGVDTRLLGQALDVPSTMPLGIAQMSIDVEAPLGSWRSMLQTAEGRLMFKMNEGTTVGFGFQTLLESVGPNQFFTLSNQEQGEELFTSLNFEGALADGVATIVSAQINYEEGTVQLEGVAPYKSGGIALTATVEPAKESVIPETRQFFIGGSWDRAFATALRAPTAFGE